MTQTRLCRVPAEMIRLAGRFVYTSVRIPQTSEQADPLRPFPGRVKVNSQTVFAIGDLRPASVPAPVVFRLLHHVLQEWRKSSAETQEPTPTSGMAASTERREKKDAKNRNGDSFRRAAVACFRSAGSLPASACNRLAACTTSNVRRQTFGH